MPPLAVAVNVPGAVLSQIVVEPPVLMVAPTALSTVIAIVLEVADCVHAVLVMIQ